ncbi:MAG: response regulator transcription factor [Gammaproteobacteria bacterium]|nr:response regulator transcription factor [Gammaproteobacteria bacterium]NIR94901.1 response regulator transcription factor [Gammaproteobacteria bacterium]NIW43971.1 response regulator [Gammaproteobacteria bacterium]
MVYTIVAADSHPLSLMGVSELLKTVSDLELMASCETAEDTLHKVWELKPDILLIDIDLPDRKGLELINELRNTSLDLKIVILTASMDEEQTIDALKYGVKGVVLKNMPVHLLVQCLQKVATGGLWMEKESIGQAFEKMLQREAGMRRLTTILTSREIEVMKQVAGGLSNQQIADKLIVQEGTVKIHIHNIYRKLGIKNRVDLTLYAQKRGLV